MVASEGADVRAPEAGPPAGAAARQRGQGLPPTVTVGVDIGGTKIATGAVTVSGEIMARAQRRTDADDPAAVERSVAECVKDLSEEVAGAGLEVSGVGVAAAGYASSDRATMMFAPNLAWRDHPLGQRLHDLTGQHVVVENDANAAAWAEYRFGGGRGHQDVLMVTLGTGVGGGIVESGRLLRGARGFAAEIGHVRAVKGGLLCGCGLHGCWEQYISGTALVQQAKERARRDPDWSPDLLALAGGDVGGITGPHVTEAARGGDHATRGLLAEIGILVGEFSASLVAVLDPGVVVVGGGVATAGDLLLGPAQESFVECLSPYGRRPPPVLRAAELGNEAGLVGAADLARGA